MSVLNGMPRYESLNNAMVKNTLLVSVVICSVGRKAILEAILPSICNQTLPPLEVIIVTPSADDAPDLPDDHSSWDVTPRMILSRKGLCVQRNVGLAAVYEDSDIVFFIDDDYVASHAALEGMVAFFQAHRTVNGASGRLLVDGINFPDYSVKKGLAVIAKWDRNEGKQAPLITGPPVSGLYGCNMAFRLDVVRDMRFDENLPLYGWLEDVDFASRVTGIKTYTSSFVGVHCGVKLGRETSGKSLGYSQVANPYYLMRKGSVPVSVCLRNIIRTFLANHVKVLTHEPDIDRKGRLAGNWKALSDVVTGKAHPTNILEFR